MQHHKIKLKTQNEKHNNNNLEGFVTICTHKNNSQHDNYTCVLMCDG